MLSVPMAYFLSATKLQSYHRCPQAYYFKYERGLQAGTAFGTATLGIALHQTLAQFYQDWHYQEPLPELTWLASCWTRSRDRLTPAQQSEGWLMLQDYYAAFVQPAVSLRRPLAVEGKIQGTLEAEGLEFRLSGRYDRLDLLPDGGLELIDYKSSKSFQPPAASQEIEIQLGLYYLALEQRYQRALQKLSLINLRTSEKFSFAVTPDHKKQVQRLICHLALQLRADYTWEPQPGNQCDRCSYRPYCPAIHSCPQSLPDDARNPPQLQLTLGLKG
ncbi:PD-(D/E)XK nuclease family protein [Sphaerothrix gracilis]|uniref:RecB family exonuclease n=1 Tax=Sphaerothrix gracilis TaxID=3151835 RepID=UPI0031FD64DC